MRVNDKCVVKSSWYSRHQGLTLIEVLVALAIIAIAMTAAIKATSTDISGIAHLQEKTMAMWVGEQAINEARVGILTIPSNEPLRQQTRLLGRNWYWVLSKKATPNPRIEEIDVKVFAEQTDEESERYLVHFTSYLYLFGQEKKPMGTT